MSATEGLEESLEEEDQLLEEDDEIILDEEEKTSEDLDGSEVLETEVVTLDEDGGSAEESVNQIAVGVPEDNVIVLGEEEEEDDMDLPVDDEDDVLMDDEVYTPPAEAYGNNSSNSPSTGSNDLSSSGVESNFATVLRYANVARQVLNSRHPKFRHLNNMEIVHKMVAKGKVVNPADDDDEEDEVTKEDVFLTPRQTKVLEETEGVRVCTEMRSEDDRNGTEVVEVPEGGKNRGLKSKVIVLGGGIPLEPVLAQKRLNEEVEQFRYDLQKHRRCWDNVVFRHPQRKVGWKVDPSTIVPKNNDENDPEAAAATGGREAAAPSSKKAGQLFAPGEIYSTDEDWDVELGKDSELVQGTISAWTFLDEDEEDNRAASRPVPPLKHIQQQHTISGKYHQQMMRQTGTPTPQKQHLSQQQQLQSQGQRSSYMDQRSMSSSTKKVSGRSRSSGTNRHNEPKRNPKDGKVYPKPAFSYSCLIALSLKNSKTGALPVSEIYKFMCDHFPYFNTAPSGWKNSVRHNLSLNKCFEKYGEGPAGNSTNSRKGCLWTLNPAKIHKMDEEVQKWSRKDPTSITVAMSDPENLELLERGEMKKDYSGGNSDDEEEEFVDGNSMTYTLAGGLPMEFGTITNVTGNYSNDGRTIDPSTSQQVVVTSANNGGMTYSVVTYGNEGRVNSRSNNAGQSTTPLIIRRTVVKS